MAQVHVCEKYIANGEVVFWAFMYLEKAYVTIDRHGMWSMLRVYGVGRKLLKAGQRFYVDSREYVRVGVSMSKWFLVNIGLRQGSDVSMVVECIYGWRGASGEC